MTKGEVVELVMVGTTLDGEPMAYRFIGDTA